MHKKSHRLASTKIILEYLEKFKEAPSKTIARKIYNENLGFFDCLENVYVRVRYYRGQAGKKSRKHNSELRELESVGFNGLKTRSFIVKIEDLENFCNNESLLIAA